MIGLRLTTCSLDRRGVGSTTHGSGNLARILEQAAKVMAVVLLASLSFAKCGVERWPVKTLADADVSTVSFAPTQITVHELLIFTPPTRKQLQTHNSRRFPSELKTYQITGMLVGYKLESDEDYHIVIKDRQTGETMIMEVPSAHCWATTKYDPAGIRKALDAKYGKAKAKLKPVPGSPVITVTGVGFFDFLHGQTGVAGNGIELHPVLGIKGIQ